MSGAHEEDPVQVVLDLDAAIRDNRIKDMIALLDREVVCHRLVRPGQSVYCGPDDMIKMVGYLHAAYGDYQVEIDNVTEEGGGQEAKATVTVQGKIVPARGHGQPVPVTTVFTVRAGLIMSIDEAKTRH